MKRDVLFMAERLANLLDGNRLEMLARQHGLRQKRDDGGVAKTFGAFLRRADESTLGRAVVEAVILLTASRGNTAHVLRETAEVYKVDVAAITATVKDESVAKEKAKNAKKAAPRPLVSRPE
jgi:ParB family chromosome partitioning protein